MCVCVHVRVRVCACVCTHVRARARGYTQVAYTPCTRGDVRTREDDALSRDEEFALA